MPKALSSVNSYYNRRNTTFLMLGLISIIGVATYLKNSSAIVSSTSLANTIIANGSSFAVSAQNFLYNYFYQPTRIVISHLSLQLSDYKYIYQNDSLAAAFNVYKNEWAQNIFTGSVGTLGTCISLYSMHELYRKGGELDASKAISYAVNFASFAASAATMLSPSTPVNIAAVLCLNTVSYLMTKNHCAEYLLSVKGYNKTLDALQIEIAKFKYDKEKLIEKSVELKSIINSTSKSLKDLNKNFDSLNQKCKPEQAKDR